jgi:hypothetical protein
MTGIVSCNFCVAWQVQGVPEPLNWYTASKKSLMACKLLVTLICGYRIHVSFSSQNYLTITIGWMPKRVCLVPNRGLFSIVASGSWLALYSVEDSERFDPIPFSLTTLPQVRWQVESDNHDRTVTVNSLASPVLSRQNHYATATVSLSGITHTVWMVTDFVWFVQEF